MYLPRSLVSKLYLHLQNTRHPLSPPVLILVGLEPDAICACRILTRLLKHDYIPHKIQPVAGYADLERAGRDLVAPMMESQGGSGGVVICLGVGGMVDLGTLLGLEPEGDETPFGGVEVWVIDSHRPWNLGNVFGGFPLEAETEQAVTYQARSPAGIDNGRIDRGYKPGKGGIVVFDDGDIDEGLDTEKKAYLTLVDMPDVDDDGEDLDDSGLESEDDESPEDSARPGQKRKSFPDRDDDEFSDEDRPRQRRRSNSVRLPRSSSLLTKILTGNPSPVPSRTLLGPNREAWSRYVTKLAIFRVTRRNRLRQLNYREALRPELFGDDSCAYAVKMKGSSRSITRLGHHSRNRFPQWFIL